MSAISNDAQNNNIQFIQLSQPEELDIDRWKSIFLQTQSLNEVKNFCIEFGKQGNIIFVADIIASIQEETSLPNWWHETVSTGGTAAYVLNTIVAFYAAQDKNELLLRNCLESTHGIDLSYTDVTGKTLLMHAATGNMLEATLDLIDLSSNLLAQDTTQKKAIDYIFEAFDWQDIFTNSKKPTQLLCSLFEADKRELATEILDFLQGLPDDKRPRWYASYKNDRTAIFCAAAAKGCAREELTSLITPNYYDTHHKRPIQYAIGLKMTQVVKSLLKDSLSYSDDTTIQTELRALIENFNETDLAGILSTIDITCETTLKILSFLLRSNKRALATTLTQKIEALPTAQQPVWWKSSSAKAELFCAELAGGHTIESLPPSINVHYIDSQGRTPLSYIAEKRLESIAKELINRGARLNHKNPNGKTVAQEIDLSMGVQFLNGIISEKLLHIKTSPEVILLSLDRGRCPSTLLDSIRKAPKNKQPSWFKNEEIRTTICIHALSGGFEDEALRLIEDGINVNCTSDPEQVPLILAAKMNLVKVISKLLEKGARLDILNSLPYIALETNYKQLVLNFLSNWDITKKETVDLICQLYNTKAGFVGHFTLGANVLLEKVEKLSPSSRPAWWNDPLCRSKILAFALEASDTKQIRLLYADENIEPNYITADGSPLFGKAAWRQETDLVSLLIKKGARIGTKYTSNFFSLSSNEIYGSQYGLKWLQHFLNNRFITNILNNWDVSRKDTGQLLQALIQSGWDTNETLSFISQIRTQCRTASSWWNDSKERSALFIATLTSASSGSYSQLIEELVRTLDVSYEDEKGTTPLGSAIKADNETLMTLLIERGASIGKELKSITKWSFFTTLLSKYPLNSDLAYSLIIDLYNYGNPEDLGNLLLERLMKIPENAPKPTWQSDQKKMAKIFFAVSDCMRREGEEIDTSATYYTTCIAILTYLASKIDPNAKDEWGQTPLMHAAHHKLKEIVQDFVTRGALLSTRAEFEIANSNGFTNTASAYHIIQQQCTSQFAHNLLEALPLSRKELGTLLATLIQEEFYDEARALFTRLSISSTIPPSWTIQAKTEVFFRLAASHMETTSKTVMMTTLLSDIDIRQKSPVDGKYALLTLLESKVVPLSNSVLKATLNNLGISNGILEEHTTHESLLSYLKGIFHLSDTPIEQRIAMALFCNDSAKVTEYFRTLSLNDRLIIIDTIDETHGREFALSLINAAFSINPTHFAIEEDIEMAPKPTTISIEAVRTMYQKFATISDEKEASVLKQFEERVATNVALLNTPQGNNSLVQAYKRIETATCHIIDHFQKKIALLERTTNQEFTTLLATNQDAQVLVRDIRSWLQDLITFCGRCGPGLHTNVMMQYRLIVEGKKKSYQEELHHCLAQGRLFLIEELISSNHQSVHVYAALAKRYGAALGLPGHTLQNKYNDPYAEAHVQNAERAKNQFDEAYTPLYVLNTLRNALITNEDQNKLMDYLVKHASDRSDEECALTIQKDLKELFKTFSGRQKIPRYLEERCLLIDDRSSLESCMFEINLNYMQATKKSLFRGMQQRLRNNTSILTLSAYIRGLVQVNALKCR